MLKFSYQPGIRSNEAESWYIASGLKSTKFIRMMTLGWPFTFLWQGLLWQGQICVLIHVYGDNVEKSFSENVLKTNGLNLQCMIKVLKTF